jgi:hypothetical protein
MASLGVAQAQAMAAVLLEIPAVRFLEDQMPDLKELKAIAPTTHKMFLMLS